jgi:hypothetical protein
VGSCVSGFWISGSFRLPSADYQRVVDLAASSFVTSCASASFAVDGESSFVVAASHDVDSSSYSSLAGAVVRVTTTDSSSLSLVGAAAAVTTPDQELAHDLGR